MEYTVNALATLAGVSPRTLRWYDETGLLCPHRAANGYRLYGPEQVDRLQQILFYRASGLPLSDIQTLLQQNEDPVAAMEKHLANLRRQRTQLDALISTAEQTLRAKKGEITMSDKQKFESFKKELIEENEKKYGKEVRERWGSTTAEESNRKMMNMTEEQYRQFEELGRQLNETLAAAAAEGNPNSPAAQSAAALHKQWLCFTWPQYSAAAHRGLTEMYLADDRFKQYYEKIAPGAAQLLHDAVAIYTKGQD